MLTAIITLGAEAIKGVTSYFEGKRKLKEAVTENRARLAQSEMEYNHEWEMKQLENAGYKDDVIFYAIIGLFVWSGFYPEQASIVFQNWTNTMPPWIIEITGWLVGSVIGVKKLGEYLPSLISGCREAWKPGPIQTNTAAQKVITAARKYVEEAKAEYTAVDNGADQEDLKGL